MMAARRSLDMCMTVCGDMDLLCLDAFLYSARRFGDLDAVSLLVAVNSSDSGCRRALLDTCAAHGVTPSYVDEFPRRSGFPAWQHGESLNRLVGRTTADRVIFVDPDILLTSPTVWPHLLSRIEGRFMVGTPYHDAQAKTVWQGTFPNIWFAIVDGPALRRSGVDMRPGSKHLCPDGWMPDGRLRERWISVAGQEPPPPEWARRGGKGSRLLRITGWELAGHALKCGLAHEGLEFHAGGGSRKNRGRNLGCAIEQWGRRHLSGVSAVECAAVVRVLREVSPLEFRLPDGRETCCLHLLQTGSRPDRAKAWLGIATRIVDLCALMAGC